MTHHVNHDIVILLALNGKIVLYEIKRVRAEKCGIFQLVSCFLSFENNDDSAFFGRNKTFADILVLKSFFKG